jgi:hypothetical protein
MLEKNKMRGILAPVLAALLLMPRAVMGQTAPAGGPTSAPIGAPAAAPTPVESITIIATRPSEAVIDSFILSRATPTRVAGKLARWKVGICPLTMGLDPHFSNYVADRIREVAAAVGAPVDPDPACKPNIEVVFTTTPQVLMDNVRKTQPVYLGYHDNGSQAAELAKVTHPMQAWYTTATDDTRGRPQVDSGASGGTTITIQPIHIGGSIQQPSGTITLTMPHASAQTVTGSRLADGLSSELYNVLIVAEPAKLLAYGMGTLSDYAAMLALAQPSLDACEELPSISNLLAPNCTATTERLTDGDLAYLRAIYKMGPADKLSVQHDQIRFQMEQTLVTDKGSH